MAMILLIAFIAVPLIEIAVFIQVGQAIGLWTTLGLVVLTAVIGTWQLRAQGLATLARARTQIDRGVLPTRELFDGACLLIAGALLLTPGFVTDTVGFLLFLPPLRDALRRALARRIEAEAEARVWVDGEEIRAPQDDGQRRGGRTPPVIEGEYRDVSDDRGRAGEERRNGRPRGGQPEGDDGRTPPQ